MFLKRNKFHDHKVIEKKENDNVFQTFDLDLKRIVPDEHVQAMSREERENKSRSHATQEEPIKNHPHSSRYA